MSTNVRTFRGRVFGGRAAAVLVAVLALVTVGVVQPPSPAMASADGCVVTVDNPHYSGGAGGVIAKAHVTCMSKKTVSLDSWIGSGPLVGPHVTTYSATQTRVVDPAKKPSETFYIPVNSSGTAFQLPCDRSKYYSAWTKVTVGGQTDQAWSNRATATCP